MLFLLSVTHSLRKAFLIQLILFGVMHVKGFDLWALIDVFSVIVLAAGFTYAAYKTRLLVAGIVFHFVHDALLFFVQTTGTEASNTLDNVRFYLFLWVMVGVACLLVRVAADRFGVRAPDSLYDLEVVGA